MLISLNGLSAGTIGGGAVEYQCIQVAKELIGTTEGRSVSFSLNAKRQCEFGHGLRRKSAGAIYAGLRTG